MALIHVRAASITTAEDTIFDCEDAGLRDGRPTRALVFGDGKAVLVEGRHREVKAALKDGRLIEVKTHAAKDEGRKTKDE